MTLDEVCEYLRVERATIYKMVHQKRIPFRKVGHLLRFPRKALLEWLENPDAVLEGWWSGSRDKESGDASKQDALRQVGVLSLLR